MSEQTQAHDGRPWPEYRIVTKMPCFNGGWWMRTERGWKWCTGDTFPNPVPTAFDVTLPMTTPRSTRREAA